MAYDTKSLFPPRQTTYVINQGKGYSLAEGKKQELPLWVTAYQGLDTIPVLSRMGDYLSTRTNLRHVGQETVAGRPTIMYDSRPGIGSL